jgi:hypothetical protein
MKNFDEIRLRKKDVEKAKREARKLDKQSILGGNVEDSS